MAAKSGAALLRRFFLLGPTASGKTAVALELAPRLGAEIFSMDSMLVYRGMDIGTAKPSAEEQARVRHHLIDLVGPEDEFSVARWLAAADAAEAEAAARGKHALYVGGTGLYLKARTAGLFEGPTVPGEIRAAVESALGRGARAELRAELERADPALFARLHPNDDKRLARGVETWRATGRPLSEWQAQWARAPGIGAPAVALGWEREALRQRVEQRFDQMLAEGFGEEVRRIRDTTGFSRSAGKALGYRQVLDHLAGHCTLPEARAKAITLTRAFIRRQMTWLRSFPDLDWLPASSGAPPADLAARALEAL